MGVFLLFFMQSKLLQGSYWFCYYWLLLLENNIVGFGKVEMMLVGFFLNKTALVVCKTLTGPSNDIIAISCAETCLQPGKHFPHRGPVCWIKGESSCSSSAFSIWNWLEEGRMVSQHSEFPLFFPIEGWDTQCTRLYFAYSVVKCNICI